MKKNIFPALIALSVLFSCTDPIDLDFSDDNGRSLVVNSNFKSGMVENQLYLFYTAGYTDSSYYLPIENADVTISSVDESYSMIERSFGLYTTDSTEFQLKVGKGYTLNIVLPNGEKYQAYDSVRELIPMDSISYMYQVYLGMPVCMILYHGKDKPGEGDSYLYYYSTDKGMASDSLNEITYATDELWDGQYLPDGFNTLFGFINNDLPDADTFLFTVETRAVTRNYYNYVEEMLYQSSGGGGMFSVPPANVSSTNIKAVGHDKEAFGYWYVYSADTASVTIIKRTREELMN